MARVNTAGLSYRQFQAKQTRDRIAAAARRLFALRGYTDTSIEAIASEAGVSVRTVYTAFGNKRQILKAVRLGFVFAAETPDLMRAAFAESDHGSRLALAARWTRRQLELGAGDVRAVYRSAAVADTEMAVEWEGVQARYRKAVRRLLADMLDGLKPELSLDDAIAVYMALTSPEIFRELVERAGWSADRYEDWLAGALKLLLIRD